MAAADPPPAASSAAEPSGQPAPTMDSALLASAIAAFETGDYPRCVELVRGAGAAGLDNAEAQFFLGYSLLRQEDLPAALEAIERAVRLRPADLRAVYLRGVVRARLEFVGAQEDFVAVQQGLPDTAIGRSAAEYLAELAKPRAAAGEATAADATGQGADVGGTSAVADSGSGGTSPPPAALDAASAIAPEPEAVWRPGITLRVSGDYDTNPSFTPRADAQGALAGGPPAELQLLGGASAAPALSLAGTATLEHDVSETWRVSGVLSAFQRLYLPGRGALRRRPMQPALTAAGTPMPSSAPMGGMASVEVGSRDNDLSLGAVTLGAEGRVGPVLTRLDYKGELTLFGFAPFAQQHSTSLRVTWPAQGAVSGSLLATGYALRPLDAVYDYLGGYGATLEPLASWLTLGDALLIEGGLGLDAYSARDYSATFPAGVYGPPLHFFYSYSYVGIGPDVYVSFLAPHGTHLSLALGVARRVFADDDRAPGFLPIRRIDVRWSASARATWGMGDAKGSALLAELTYLDNRSNLDAAQHDDRNARRLLFSFGLLWQ